MRNFNLWFTITSMLQKKISFPKMQRQPKNSPFRDPYCCTMGQASACDTSLWHEHRFISLQLYLQSSPLQMCLGKQRPISQISRPCIHVEQVGEAPGSSLQLCPLLRSFGEYTSGWVTSLFCLSYSLYNSLFQINKHINPFLKI